MRRRKSMTSGPFRLALQYRSLRHEMIYVQGSTCRGAKRIIAVLLRWTRLRPTTNASPSSLTGKNARNTFSRAVSASVHASNAVSALAALRKCTFHALHLRRDGAARQQALCLEATDQAEPDDDQKSRSKQGEQETSVFAEGQRGTG